MSRLVTRARLRTKTGCLTCRQQKKKCDETKPTCQFCLHYRRTCVWPTVFADGRNGKRRPDAPSPATTEPIISSSPDSMAPTPISLVGQHEELFSSSLIVNENYNPYDQINWYPTNMAAGQDRLLFHHFSTCTLPRAIRAHAHPVYAAYKDVYQVGFQMPDVMNVFLGIAALRIGQNSRNSAIKATQLYIPSVNAVQRSIKDREVNGTEDWLLVVIAFMVVFEVSHSGSDH